MDAHEVVGQPWIVDHDRIAEGDEHRPQGASEIAEADEAGRSTGKKEAALIAGESVAFLAASERTIGRRDAAGEIDRHGKGRFGYCGRKGSARAQDPDAPLAAGLIIDVREK